MEGMSPGAGRGRGARGGSGVEAGPGRGLVPVAPAWPGSERGRMAPGARHGGCEQRAPGGAAGTAVLGPQPRPSPGPAPFPGAAPLRSRKMWGALLGPLLRLVLLLSPRDGVHAAQPQAP